MVEFGVFFPFKPRDQRRVTPVKPHIGHTLHLCHLVQEGSQTLEQIKELVHNPHYICKKCGRVAKENTNLCEPVTLE